MQIDENHDSAGLWIDAYEHGCIHIDGEAYHGAVCLNGQAVLPVSVAVADDLCNDDFAALLQAPARPELVLIGTGAKQVFLHPRVTAALAAAGIGVETMSTAAACRTYMILRSEARQVWAWLWP